MNKDLRLQNVWNNRSMSDLPRHFALVCNFCFKKDPKMEQDLNITIMPDYIEFHCAKCNLLEQITLNGPTIIRIHRKVG